LPGIPFKAFYCPRAGIFAGTTGLSLSHRPAQASLERAAAMEFVGGALLFALGKDLPAHSTDAGLET